MCIAGKAIFNFGQDGHDVLAEHPQLRTTTGMTENGPVEFIASPMRFDGKSQEFGPVPSLNQQGDAIRAEFAADKKAAE